jgi:hypothetical protein
MLIGLVHPIINTRKHIHALFLSTPKEGGTNKMEAKIMKNQSKIVF